MAVILVAEDDLHTLRVVSLWLQRNGQTVCEARNGQEALEHLRTRPVDLLICDVNMPAMTGMELLAAAARENLMPPGLIVLSSRCDQQEIARQIRAYDGVVHPKPFSPSRLIRLVEEKLSRRIRPSAVGSRHHE